MGTPFANPVVGGGGALVVPVIRSPNFSIAGQTGWAIMSNGDAFFYNIVAEGSISSNTVVVSGSGEGVFIYSGAPAAGNLVGSWAGASGTDAFGNTYTSGLAIGAASVGPQVALDPSSGPGTASSIAFPMASPVLSNPPNIAGGSDPTLVISGPSLAASGKEDWVQIILWGNDAAPARLEFRRISTTGAVTVSASYNNSGWTFFDTVSMDGVFEISGTRVVPVGTPSMASLPADTNSGTTWVSGERAFMNNNWVNNVNSNFVAIVAALQAAGIFI
jgi:hypothetical protein